MRKCKRDIYKSRQDKTFIIERDIDLSDLLHLLQTRQMSKEENDRFGHYVDNIASIILQSYKFVGFPESVKHDIRSLGSMDVLKGYRNFKASQYTSATAPFSYIYRIIYNRATHVCKDYYRTRCVSFSQMPETFERNVADMALEEEKRERLEQQRAREALSEKVEALPSLDLIRNRLKATVHAVLKRKIQMELKFT